jgi:histidyl-tRNA synthetase
LHGTALVAVDKLDKIGPTAWRRNCASAACPKAAERLLRGVQGGGDTGRRACAPWAAGWPQNDPPVRARIENLRQIVALAAGTKAEGRIRIESVAGARPLVLHGRHHGDRRCGSGGGSLGGGGRYDNLVGNVPRPGGAGCGFSLGLERILVVMGERKHVPAGALDRWAADVMVSVFDQKDLGYATAVAGRLARRRTARAGLPGRRQDRQADQVLLIPGAFPSVALLGSNEVSGGQR